MKKETEVVDGRTVLTIYLARGLDFKHNMNELPRPEGQGIH